MTDYSTSAPPPLGVGTIFGDSFSTVFRHLGPMMLLAGIPAVLGQVVNIAVYGVASQNVILAVTDPELYLRLVEPVAPGMQVLTTLLGLLLTGIAMAIVVHATYQSATDGQVNVGRAISGGLSQIVPVIICSLVVLIATYIGIILLIVPGLYIMALWFVVVPAIVVERCGPKAFGRSAQLTEGYRWPLVGLFLLYLLIMIAVGVIGILIHYLGFNALGETGYWIGYAVSAVLGAFTYAFGSTMTARAYMRLREIKEGFGINALREIFA